MSFTHKDQQLWDAVVKDVQPLNHKHIATIPKNCFKKPSCDYTHHTIDLHGMTLQDAHNRVQDHLYKTQQIYKYITIITGKSGQLSQDVSRWLNCIPGIRKIESANHNGSIKVWFNSTKKMKR